MTVAQSPVRHIYNFLELDQVPEGPCSGTVTPRRLLSGDTLASGKYTALGAVLTGQRAHVALIRQPRGTGSKIHSHPNEQFTYVLQGALITDIDGQVQRVAKGEVWHIPAGMPHGQVASPEQDVIFISAKDTRHGIVGPAADGKHDGPRFLPGYGSGTNVWATGPDGMPFPQTVNLTGKKVRYVYGWKTSTRYPTEPCSATVTPRGYISKKSSSRGAALSGEALHVAIVHKAVGSGTKLHTHPNEQFSYVLEGTMLYEISGDKLEAPPGSLTHLPPGIVHGAIASAAGDVWTFVVKDASHGMSGPPIDGVEDGPVFLPGFGPQKK